MVANPISSYGVIRKQMLGNNNFYYPIKLTQLMNKLESKGINRRFSIGL